MIDASKISQHDLNNLSHPLLQTIADYFKLPGVQEEFEAWLIKYKERKATP